MQWLLIASCNQYTAFRWLAAYHINTRSLLEHERHAAYCSLCLFLDFSLGLGCSVPMAEEETAILYFLLKLLVVVALVDVVVAELESFGEDVVLNLVEEVLYTVDDTINADSLLL